MNAAILGFQIYHGLIQQHFPILFHTMSFNDNGQLIFPFHVIDEDSDTLSGASTDAGMPELAFDSDYE